MSDPNEQDKKDDDELLEDLDADEDAENVSGGQIEDPCAGGQYKKK